MDHPDPTRDATTRATDGLDSAIDGGADDAVQAEVRSLLADQPDPGPMPPEVEDRVAQALLRAGEIRLNDRELFDELGLQEEPVDEPDDDVIVFPGASRAAESPGDARSADPVLGHPGDPHDPSAPDGGARRSGLTSRGWPVLAAAAAVVALLAFAGITLFGATRSGTDGLASIPGPGSASTSTGVATAVSGRLHIQASGVAYTADTLAAGARALLTSPGPEVGADQATTLGPLATTDGANACVAALGDADAPSVTVDLATYAGQPAAVVVIARDGKTTAYAVQRGCATGDPEVLKDSVPVP